jgi:2-keto-4-pentenoate hydratase/2-oxohepta-3-ene-1,7-dioic acid hydratase in catechol pathway
VTAFGLGTFASGGDPFAGLVLGERAVPIGALEGFQPDATVSGLLADWDRSFERLSVAAAHAPDGVPLEECRILPPIHPPGPYLCGGANYRRHMVQMVVGHELARDRPRGEATAEAERLVDERRAAGVPFVFAGWPGAVCGAFDDVILPSDGIEYDWELELAIVIGRDTHHVDQDHAMRHVAGYTIVNDISTRDRMFRTDVPMTDFMASKMRPTFKPTGPWITPTEFVPDPGNLRITLLVNGETMQGESTADMIFGVPRLVEYASRLTRLAPGDLILTGSPAGNAAHHGGRFLKPGDVMDGAISGLGMQRNRCIAASNERVGPDISCLYRRTPV